MEHASGMSLLLESMDKQSPREAEEFQTFKSQFSRSIKEPTAERSAQIERDNAEEKLREENERLKIAISRSKIPQRLLNGRAAIKDTKPNHPWNATLRSLQHRMEGQNGILVSLLGDYGTGKGMMACELIHSFAAVKKSSLFIYAADLFDSVKEVYRTEESTVRKQLAIYRQPDFLVIDEVNQGLSEVDCRYLQRIITYRYDDIRETLLISNEKPEIFAKLIGDRIISRMQSCGGIIECNWPSFRTPRKGK